MSEETELNKKITKTPKGGGDCEKKPRSRKAKEGGGKRRGRQKKMKSSSDSDDDDDVDENCAANGCQKPTGQNVDWVQCDGGCEKWFHMACVGLSAEEINEDEDYICVTCSLTTKYEEMNSGSNSPLSPDSTSQPSTSKDIS